MTVTKQQIINGIVLYIKDSLIQQIPDNVSRRVIAGFADLMSMRPSVFDKLTDKYPVLDLIEDEDGNYDIELAENLLHKNMREYGNVTIKIMGDEFTFSSADITILRRAIENGILN